MKILYRFPGCLMMLMSVMLLARAEMFNADSAWTYTRHLSVTVGPRPMGSANDREALGWTVGKFRSMGADTAYIMQFSRSPGGINTRSGIAVGIFFGESDSIIVIGGHIDSTPRDNPGANDNASGSACTIELARVWSKIPRRYTLLFAAFSGEERGMVGSQYFVDHFPAIDRVALMLNIDMAGSEGPLVPFFDAGNHQCPKWLVEDAFAIDRALGYNSLAYPTHFFSWNNLFQFAESDHLPFMNRGIPAIGFTAGINTSPVHTPLDKIDFVHKRMLERSGLIVQRLLEKYQEQGIPSAKTGRYMMWEAFGVRLYISHWQIVALNVLAILLGILAFWWGKRNRLLSKQIKRARMAGPKLLLMILIIAVFAQTGEALMQLLKGLRYPWAAPFREYLWFAAIWGVAGIWIALQLSRKLNFGRDPFVYTRGALVLLLIYTGGFLFFSPRVALYPGLTLGIFSLGVLLPGFIFKTIAMILASLPMFRLLFNEALPLFARSSLWLGFQVKSTAIDLIYSAILTAVLVVWFLPTLYIIAYTTVGAKPLRHLARACRGMPAGFLILLAIVGYGGYLYSFPAYNEKWKALLQVEADYDARNGHNSVDITGNEYLRNVTVKTDTLRRHYDARILKTELARPFTADWLIVEGDYAWNAEDPTTVSLDCWFISRKPWYSATLTLKTDTLAIDSLITNYNYRKEANGVSLTWAAEPPETLAVEARLLVPQGVRLIREITARYPEMPFSIEVTAEHALARYQTQVIYRDTLKLKE